jgi:murein DD-endopeptidase MepM/ murein hydrolase activator NlpD
MWQLPRPFLHRIFQKEAEPAITEGWVYGAQETATYGGYSAHHAVDFAVPAETPVLAAADGLALASFEEVPIRYPTPQQRTWHGKPIFWGHGLHVIILHRNHYATIYAHLHRIAPLIQPAYRQPLEYTNGDVLSALAPLRAEDIHNPRRAVRVKTGQVLGYAGITGMGWGQRTYDNWLRGARYRSNDEVHLHFALSDLPALDSETTFLDPFGVYGSLTAYPPYDTEWSTLPGSLWLK